MQNAAQAAHDMAPGQQEIDTWQVGDTLLARYCGGQEGIFDIVAQRAGTPDFAALRRQAQNALDACGSPYGLAEVYRRMEVLGLESGQARALLAEELRVEREQSIPIRSNLERLGQHDIVLADTCLPSAFVDELLATAGMQNRRPVSAGPGLQAPAIWPLLQKHYRLRTHHQAAPGFDADLCRLQGIPVEQVNGGGNADWERRLIEQGETQLAALLRECRLRSVGPEGSVSHDLVCGPLMTALLLNALELGEHYRHVPAMLFSAGEADFLSAVFRALFPAMRTVSLQLPLHPGAPEVAAVTSVIAPAEGALLVCPIAARRRAAEYLDSHADRQLALHALYATEGEGGEGGVDTANGFRYYRGLTAADGAWHKAAALFRPGYGKLVDLVFEPVSGAQVPQYLHEEPNAVERRFFEFKHFAVHNLIQALRRRPIDALPAGKKRVDLLKQALAALLA